MLGDTLRVLRELEWPHTLPALPGHVARLFVRALETGVEAEWVRAAIRTRHLAAPPEAPESWPWAVRVRALGNFEVSTEAGRLPNGRKAASKRLELLRVLAAHGHAAVRVDLIAESLWPGDGREGRKKAFEVTLARLRRLLDCDAAVVVHDNRARLNGEIVWSDVQALNDHLARGEAADGDAPGRCHPRRRPARLPRCLPRRQQPAVGPGCGAVAARAAGGGVAARIARRRGRHDATPRADAPRERRRSAARNADRAGGLRPAARPRRARYPAAAIHIARPTPAATSATVRPRRARKPGPSRRSDKEGSNEECMARR